MSRRISSVSGGGWGKKGKKQPGLSGYKKKYEQGNNQQSGLSDSEKYEQGAIEKQ